MGDPMIKPKDKPQRDPVDWLGLEHEFILNQEYPKARTWLREKKKWSEEQIEAGNTSIAIEGWSKKRAEKQREITKEALESYRIAERERIPQLMAAKMNLVQKLIAEIGGNTKYSELSARDKKIIYEIIKVELGEPTRITQEHKPPDKDPVEALLEDFGLMKDGVIIDVDDSADDPEAATADDSSPAEVPQD